MSPKKLLCIACDGRAGAGAPRAALAGWEVSVAAGWGEAGRALDEGDYPVGLVLGMAGGGDPAALDQFFRQHWRVLWVGVVRPRELDAPAWRALAFEHLHDFHTEPVDPQRLGHTLGHAHGCAMLRAGAGRPGGQAAPALLGHSAPIEKLRLQIAKVARSDAPVLIGGESGSGKELTAQAIHAQSRRAGAPFVPVNCGAIAPSLIQSELFGHARGAFTGASKEKAGLIESAAGGTLFLDEIADLPKELQSNLLRFLQEKTICRIGATRSIEVDARVIAASHVDLHGAVAQGAFREDLYYRLNVLPVNVPALRERREDLALLAGHFFDAYAAEKSPRVKGFSEHALRAIRRHDWPGNVRELINRTRRAMVLSEGRLIGPLDLGLAPPPDGRAGEALGQSRNRAERLAIGASLERAGRNITHAARELGVSRMTLYRLLAKHGIAP
ncbi:sigma-54 dependent transcriptional regulator [Massilia glaciei]|uniref:Sigma-54-dependent Fis family transcriptional regulator n=1 Tax=Massilia glaciei TaxID=1524097 RepID=A0A2U2I523_9BURK|nr:sigma-54 dependent transcriptional regulator [Massilia glaciei]PWF54827.1 sigma-54-dependent Fis family transcriptional regulator [Massilia glaciei]